MRIRDHYLFSSRGNGIMQEHFKSVIKEDICKEASLLKRFLPSALLHLSERRKPKTFFIKRKSWETFVKTIP